MAGFCEGRVVVVTGAGNGLGKAYALELAGQGAKVVVNDLGLGRKGEEGETRGAAEQVVDAIRAAGGEAVASVDDVADWDAAGRMIRTAIDSFGRLDAVVNNAGFLRDKMFASSTVEDWDAVMRVHLRGHYCPARHAVEHWRERQKAGEPVDARIINTSSGSGLQGSVGQSNYAAAKAGIAALTLVQAAELRRYGITANALAPNARTRMTESLFDMSAAEGAFDVFAPENMAQLVCWLVSTDSADVTGQVFELKGGHVWLSEGWSDGPGADKGARWVPEELGDVVRRLVAARTPANPVYGTQ